MAENESKMKLPKFTLDDMFTTQEERNNKNNEQVINIPIKDISNFPNHPYKVVDDERMEDMVESIKTNGIIQPVVVRKKEDGTYEMVSGHRRKRAIELAGLKEIKAIVENLTDEEAIIYMVDSNDKQREEILPSEKAFAYKMKMEAMKKQAGRPKKNSTPVVSDLRTNEIIGEQNGESREQVRRYIRLTELIPEILAMVDEKKIAFRPAVEISYLSEDSQYILLNIIQFQEVTPSLSQAIYLKKLEQEGKLDTDKMQEIMDEEKPNQKEKIKLDSERFEKVFPRNIVTNKEREDFLFMCVEEHNQRELQKRKNREMRKIVCEHIIKFPPYNPLLNILTY